MKPRTLKKRPLRSLAVWCLALIVGDAPAQTCKYDSIPATALGIDTVDFFKIEAQGVELEVFEGLGEVNPHRFAIDVSPEREGKGPAPELHFPPAPVPNREPGLSASCFVAR